MRHIYWFNYHYRPKTNDRFVLDTFKKDGKKIIITEKCLKWGDLKAKVSKQLEEHPSNVHLWKLNDSNDAFALEDDEDIEVMTEEEVKQCDELENLQIAENNEASAENPWSLLKDFNETLQDEGSGSDSNRSSIDSWSKLKWTEIVLNDILIYVVGLNNYIVSLRQNFEDSVCRCKVSGEQFLLIWCGDYSFGDFWKFRDIKHPNIEDILELHAIFNDEMNAYTLYGRYKWQDQKRLDIYVNRFGELNFILTKYIFHDIIDALNELDKRMVAFEWYDVVIDRNNICKLVPTTSNSWKINAVNKFVLLLVRTFGDNFICSYFLYLFEKIFSNHFTDSDRDGDIAISNEIKRFMIFVRRFCEETVYDKETECFYISENNIIDKFLQCILYYAKQSGIDLKSLGVDDVGDWNSEKRNQLFGEHYLFHFVSIIGYIFRTCLSNSDLRDEFDEDNYERQFEDLLKGVVNGKIELNDEKLKEIFTDYILPRQMLLFFVFIDFFNPTLQNIKSHPLMRLDGLVRLIDQKEERNLEGIFTYSRRGLPVDEVRNFVAHEMGMKPSNVLLFYNDRVLQSTEGRNENARISTTFIDYVEEINLDYLIVEEYDGFWVSRKSTGNEYGCKRTKSEKDKGVEMLRNLGKGAFATVNLCRIWPENKFCAMKKIKRAKEEDVMSFLREVNVMRCLKRVKHENVVQILDWFSRNNRLCLLLEYVDGGNMKSMLGDEGLCDNDIKKYGKQVTSGLCCLHANNIIHFDIKCLNILVSADRNLCKLTDFGLSRRLKRRDQKLTERNVTTTAWLQAPEIINNEPLTAKADIWSLGATIIEMATGRYPYHHLNSNQALVKIGMTRDLAYDKLNISESIKNIIAVCAKAKPEERKSAEELLNMSIFD